MKVSIIIPAFNEAKTLPTLLERLSRLSIADQIVVVDDGSTDGTVEYFRSTDLDRVTYLRHEQNRGKGYSIRRALPLCEGEVIVIQDADLEYDPNDLVELLKPFRNGARVVYGSRIIRQNNGMSYLRYYLGGRLVTLITNILFSSSLTDEPTGYKLFHRDVLTGMNLECTGFEFCPEVTAKILRRSIPIVEVPVSYNPRSFAQGKKIGWRDGVKAIYLLLKYRFRRSSS